MTSPPPRRSRPNGSLPGALGVALIALLFAAPGSAPACSPSPQWFLAPEEPVTWAPIVSAGGLSKKRPDPRFYRVVSRRPGPCGDELVYLHLGYVVLFVLLPLIWGTAFVASRR